MKIQLSTGYPCKLKYCYESGVTIIYITWNHNMVQTEVGELPQI